MAKTTYPQYRVTRWLDTSEEAMNKPEFPIFYGVDTMRGKGLKWAHVAKDGKPLLFDAQAKAAAACAQLRAELGEKP